MDSRLKEAAKLGFRRALGPAGMDGGGAMLTTGATRLADAVQRIGDGAWD
jgi:DNA repair protein RadA/Sms